MKTALITVTAPVLFMPGDYLNGQIVKSPEWVRNGKATVSLENATQLESLGYADILEKDGKAYRWAACCSGGSHEHS